MTLYALALYTVSAVSILTAVGVGIASWRFYRDN
jgi:hypothetical protein